MDFDVRSGEYTFKHSYSEKPDLSSERFREHFHTSFELLFFVCGDADFMVQNTLYRIRPGALLIAKPGEYHNIVFHTDAPYERYVIRFSPADISGKSLRKLERAESVYNIDGTELEALFRGLDKHLFAVGGDMRIEVCRGMLSILLAYLVSSMKLRQKADYINEDSRIISEYIDAHLAEINSAQDLVDALHMSKSAIYKTFTKQFNTSLMGYIRTKKCMAAKRLLSEGIPAGEVAERLGFDHYSSFYRDYRSVFGSSPSAWIEKAK